MKRITKWALLVLVFVFVIAGAYYKIAEHNKKINLERARNTISYKHAVFIAKELEKSQKIVVTNTHPRKPIDYSKPIIVRNEDKEFHQIISKLRDILNDESGIDPNGGGIWALVPQFNLQFVLSDESIIDVDFSDEYKYMVTSTIINKDGKEKKDIKAAFHQIPEKSSKSLEEAIYAAFDNPDLNSSKK
jgi:hypothetical protein